jgi:hypothetical protein
MLKTAYDHVFPYDGWPAVAIAFIVLVGRVIWSRTAWWRLVFGLVVLVVVVVAGLLVLGVHEPFALRTAVPVTTSSPRPSAAPSSTPFRRPRRVFTLVDVGEERGECSEQDEMLLRKLLAAHGYYPDRRPYVCELDGTPVDGHEDPGRTGTCVRCGQTVP